VRSILLAVLLLFVVGTGWHKYFVEMPGQYPPSFEDIASWIAWRTEEPITIVYVGSTGSPHRVQYLVDTHMVPHKYISVSQENFRWTDAPAKSIVFFEGQPDGKGTPLPEPPSTFTNEAAFTNPDKLIIGYAWANMQVDLQPAAPFPISNGKFPVTIILVFSTLAIIILLLSTIQIRITTGKTTDRPGLRIQVEITLRRAAKNEVNEGR
jgi:hypothetical protein